MSVNKNLNLDDYAQYFNDSKLWRKLKRVAKRAGRKTAYYVLVLYYVSRDPAVPTGLKLKVLGALGYFILPLDRSRNSNMNQSLFTTIHLNRIVQINLTHRHLPPKSRTSMFLIILNTII